MAGQEHRSGTARRGSASDRPVLSGDSGACAPRAGEPRSTPRRRGAGARGVLRTVRRVRAQPQAPADRGPPLTAAARKAAAGGWHPEVGRDGGRDRAGRGTSCRRVARSAIWRNARVDRGSFNARAISQALRIVERRLVRRDGERGRHRGSRARRVSCRSRAGPSSELEAFRDQLLAAGAREPGQDGLQSSPLHDGLTSLAAQARGDLQRFAPVLARVGNE